MAPVIGDFRLNTRRDWNKLKPCNDDLLRSVGKPVLILFDETLNYIGRHPEQANQFHAFLQNLTVALTSAERAVGLFSLPASSTEMTDELRDWQETNLRRGPARWSGHSLRQSMRI